MKTLCFPSNVFLGLFALGCLVVGCSDENSNENGGDHAEEKACDPVVQAQTTVHDGTSIEGAEHWTIGTHIVPRTIAIRSGATLTIDGCAIVRMGPDAGFEIAPDSDGRITTLGTATKPVMVMRDEAGKPWGRVLDRGSGQLSFSHTTLVGGGGAPGPIDTVDYGGATLVVWGDSAQLPELLTADGLSIIDSSGIGIMLRYARLTPSSRNLIVKGSSAYPVYASIRVAGSLPVDSTLQSNGVDAVLLQTMGPAIYDADAPISEDVVLNDLGLPYRVGHSLGSILVGDGSADGPSASLTLEAGVRLEFNRQGSTPNQLAVRGRQAGNGSYEPQGALIVKGLPSSPVVFTSAESVPAPGDWMGIFFKDVVDPRTHIEYAEIRYAGGDSGVVGACPALPGSSQGDADCSVIFWLQAPPPAGCISHSLIADGLGCGLYRGWHEEDMDLRDSNTFERLTGCQQSGVRQGGTCTACE